MIPGNLKHCERPSERREQRQSERDNANQTTTDRPALATLTDMFNHSVSRMKGGCLSRIAALSLFFVLVLPCLRLVSPSTWLSIKLGPHARCSVR